MSAPAGRDGGLGPGDTLLLTVIFTVFGAGVVLWAGGVGSCLLTGRGVPQAAAISGLRTLSHPADPARGWHTSMPGPVAYWTVTGLLLAVLAAAGWAVLRWGARGRATGQDGDPRRVPGLAGRAEVRRAASSAALLRRAGSVRPSLADPSPGQVGYRLGTARGVGVWCSVEDSLVLLGPPRAGKGLHLVIPTILDAPGPVVTTSTRPDNLATTLRARDRGGGPVAVFDPQHLAGGVPAGTRWSPIRGCDEPQTAMIRGRALAAGTADRMDNAGFWQAQTESALRAFLHAAALDGRPPVDLYRWSLDPAAAGEASRILHANARSAVGWADALDAIIAGDPRTRDNSWAGIRVALAALADPRVLDAVTPNTRAGGGFDPQQFMSEHGTLYLLGTATGVGATAGLLAAFIEDIAETARRAAAASAGGRLDPPLALILDEASNYVLPSLPALVSEGGGTGITTLAVLQSLAQARARWGEHDAAAIWDAAIVKIILGGGSNARDLADLATLIGERDEQTISRSRDPAGRASTTTSLRRVPILDVGALRTLPFGTGILLHRAARPIPLDLAAWTTRPDAATLTADRAGVEADLRTAARR